MNKVYYELEVGVHLSKSEDEYECYRLSQAPKELEVGYYDENRLNFLKYSEAKEYADEYVKDGVNGTYAFIYSDIFNMRDEDIEEIHDSKYFDHDIDIPNSEKWLYYIYKNDSGEIVTLINRENTIAIRK